MKNGGKFLWHLNKFIINDSINKITKKSICFYYSGRYYALGNSKIVFENVSDDLFREVWRSL